MMWSQAEVVQEKEVSKNVEEARIRNRFRYKLLGMQIYLPSTKDGLKPFSEEEIATIKQINKLVKKLAEEWSDNTAKVGFNVKPHVCSSCNKKSNKEHLIYAHEYKTDSMVIKNLCLSCYKKYI